MKWEADKARRRMRAQGVEGFDVDPDIMAPLHRPRPITPRRRKLTKAELRQMADEALARSPDVKVTVCPPQKRP
jgi:hypothetical protein